MVGGDLGSVESGIQFLDEKQKPLWGITRHEAPEFCVCNVSWSREALDIDDLKATQRIMTLKGMRGEEQDFSQCPGPGVETVGFDARREIV